MCLAIGIVNLARGSGVGVPSAQLAKYPRGEPVQRCINGKVVGRCANVAQKWTWCDIPCATWEEEYISRSCLWSCRFVSSAAQVHLHRGISACTRPATCCIAFQTQTFAYNEDLQYSTWQWAPRLMCSPQAHELDSFKQTPNESNGVNTCVY